MSRASRGTSGGRVSRLASSCPKDFEFEFFVYQNEVNYNVWWNAKGMLLWVRGLGDDSMWNSFIGCLALVGLFQVAADVDTYRPRNIVIDIIFNVVYLGHVLFMFFERVRQAMYENTNFTSCMKYGFVADIISYVHYITLILPPETRRPLKLVCYYIRLHTPFEYLWALTSSNLKGSVLGIAVKYFYIFIVLRGTFAFLWVKVRQVQTVFESVTNVLKGIVPQRGRRNFTMNNTGGKLFVARQLPGMRNIWSTAVPNTVALVNTTTLILSDLASNNTYMETTTTNSSLISSMASVYKFPRMKLVNDSRVIRGDLSVRDDTETGKFIRAFNIINPMFMPLGAIVHPTTDFERVVCLMIMIVGSLVVTGAAVASLALVISLYMRPKEVFNARFKLIMDEMISTHVPVEMRERVATFYKIYWRKQKAISLTQLLPIFPPTLPSAIYTDIYFEAQQRSPILCDLSHPFLWELAKRMVTIHYLPGDTIIKRNTKKSSIIYIAYGDVEMLTAEDDDTPILRMTRGTIINPCGGCAPMACGNALVDIRAATYCTAHILTAANLWRVALKHGKTNGQGFIVLSAFEEHFERVKRHFRGRFSPNVKYKSSILQFKQNLMALKDAKDENGKFVMTRLDYFLEIAGTYIMRNKADATMVNEADEICLRQTFPCILQPDSSLLIFWDVLMSIIIIAVVIAHPFYICFSEGKPIGFKFFDIIATAFFILDIIVHLSTGSNVEEGLAITFIETCTQQIHSYWFFLDVLATLPFFEFVGDGAWAGINKLLRAPKVFRVLKTLENVSVHHGPVLRFFSYCLFLTFATYVVAFVQHAYICINFGLCYVQDYVQTPFWGSFVYYSKVARSRVIFSMYYALSMITCTAYRMGTWELFHWHNVVYFSVSLEVTTILKILMEATYSATIMVTSTFREDYISTINDVKTFLVKNNVDPLLQKRFITYLSLCWHTDKAYSMTHKKSIFFDLPPHVYQDIVAKQRIKYILCVPFMKFLHPEDLKFISAKTRIFYTSPNEILQNTGDIGTEIFIIKQGICQLHDPDSKLPIRRISVKDSFGILECLLRFPAFYTVTAVTHVQLLAVPYKYLQNTMHALQIIDAIDYAKEQPEYAHSQMRREPFLSYEEPPPTTSLYHFPLLRKFEPDTAFMQPFTRLGFFSILRYVFPRFTIRPDGKYIYRYEWFRVLCALASSLIYPSYSYMVLQVPQLYYITFTLDIMAYFDIIQRLLVGYYNKDGVLVSHPASTAAHYLKGAFLVDFFACIPLEKLESAKYSTTERVLHELNQIQQMLMFNRVIQLYRLPRAMDVISNFIAREDILLMMKAVPFLLVMINILTTFIVYKSVTFSSDVTRTNWTITYPAKWIRLYKSTYRFNIIKNPWNLQITVFSWIVYEVTTTGCDIFEPSRTHMILALGFGILFGGMMLMYFAVRVISIRANVNTMLANFQEHMEDIDQYMKKEKLKDSLQRDVIAYYEYNFEKTGGTDYKSVLKLCDQITLRTDAILHLYGHTFAKCPILYNCDCSLLRVVGRAVRSQYFLNETTIISKGDLISDMYFVDYGTVDVRESKEMLRTEARLHTGSLFGNMENVSAICSPTDIVTTAHCHLLQINTFLFYQIIVDFPSVQVLLKQYRPKRENYIIGGLGEGSTLMTQWKEQRNLSSPTIVVSRKGVSNYLNINSRACQIYLVIVSLAVIYLDIYNAGFQSNSLIMIIFLYFFDIAFILKIPLSFIQPYVVLKGEQRISLIENRKIYFKSEFYYDLLSCLPIEVFCLIARGSKKWNVFSLLRLNRVLRVVTIRSCLKRHRTKLDINVALSTIVAVSIWFSLFAHTTACLWYTIGVHYDAIKPHSSWMHKDDGSLHCANQYVCSLYVILATFTHKRVGKVTPKNHLEVQFMIILEILSTMMFIIYVGEFSNIIQYKSYRSFGYYSKFLELQDFLSNNRVSKNLVKLVCRYSLHLWRESRGLQMPYLLETAPPCFKLKIMRGAYMHHLIMHPSFKDCEPAFLRQLVGCLTLFRYNTDLFVVREGEITDSMYLVHNGRVVEIDEDMDEETNEFTAGNHFGQVQGLIRDTPYNYSYKTTSKAEVLTLSLNNWEQLLEYFPISRYSIFKHYPNHPYSKYPSNKPKQRLDKQNEEKKREVIGQRKTEHELKGKPLNQRDLSHSESKNYKPFNSPLKVTSAGKSSKPDTAAPKSLNTVPGDIISTTKQTITKTPAAADSTTKPTATKVSATADPAAKRSTVEVKESGAKITTRLTVGAKMAAVASGAVVTGASVARPAALPASPTRNISATETLPAALSSIGKVSPTSTSRLTASKPTLIDNSDMIFKQKSEKNTLASTLEIPENSIWKSERMMPISNEDEDKHTKKATTRLNDETNESTYVAESPSISESNYIAQPPTISSNIRIASETVLKNDPSLPYFEYDTDDDSKKKEEHKLSEEFEVAPQSFMRRVTQHAKKLIGRQSAIKGSGETNPLELEEDVKATSALLQKYEEKSKKLKKPGADDGEKSLLEQYIEKHDAELASTQKEESEEEIFTRDSPRRSIVIFGNEDAPPVRNIPLEQPDDNDEVAKISRTSRRSVVVFDSEGNSSLGVLIPEETIYDSHELNDKDFQSAYEESNEKEFDYNATTVFIPSNSQSMSVNALDGSLVESNQNKISQDNTENFKEQKDEYTELPLTIAGDSKIKNFDLKQFLEDPNPTDDTISLPNVADYNINANETTTAPQSSFVSQSSTVPSSSSLKKPAVKTSLLASLFRKRKPAPNNKHENKTKASSATTEVAETSNENEGYESKLADEDDFGAEKKITHVRYVGDKVNDDETLILDDDDFEEGPSKPLSPEQILIDDDIQIKDMTEDEKKLMMMDSDVDPLFRRKDEDKKKTN